MKDLTIKLQSLGDVAATEPKNVNGNLEISEDEEHLYGDIDDLKDLIGSDVEYNNASDNTSFDADSDNGALLAVFSDIEANSVDEGDDSEQDFMDAIREANNFKVKRRRDRKSGKLKRRPPRERPVDPEVAQLLSEANEYFVKNDLESAEQFYNKVIGKDPKNFAAYETLGDIYQLQGRMNDCCNAWFLAAHMNPSDADFWKIVAILSEDLCHYRQAIYCFSRVLNINKFEWECVYHRALLHKKLGQLSKALDGFKRLYANNPYDSNILRELAALYVEYNKIDLAVELYMDIFEANEVRRKEIIKNNVLPAQSSDKEAENGSEDDRENVSEIEDELFQEDKQLFPNVNWKKINKQYKCIPFDWSSLNIIVELLLKKFDRTAENIKLVKQLARWIQRRENQTFWDDALDDSEFDERRLHNSRFELLDSQEKNKVFSLPIDIRIRLGLLRLNNNNVVEALNHFQFLFDEVFNDVYDLNNIVGSALVKAEHFQEAIDFLAPLLSIPEFNNVELYENLGKCYKETENYQLAKQFLEKVVEMKPSALEEKLSLAEVYYHLGNNIAFKNILNEVTRIRKMQDVRLSVPSLPLDQDQVPGASDRDHLIDTDFRMTKDTTNKPLLEDSMFKKYNSRKKKSAQELEREKIERERKLTQKVVDRYQSLDAYAIDQPVGNESQIRQWIDTVSDLVDVFSSVKNFFNKSRSKKFIGIIRKSKRFTSIVDYQLERLSRLNRGDNLSDTLPVMEERITLTSTTSLRGLNYDQWFELFMNLALTIAKYQSVSDAMSVVDTAEQVNVFYQDVFRSKMMKFVRLAIFLRAENEEGVTDNLRNLLNQFQFNRKIIHLFMFSLARGTFSSNNLNSTVQQKFFLRQIKAFDAVRFKTHVNGQASITNRKVQNSNGRISPYLYYVYSLLLYSSRGFLSSLQYLSWLKNEIEYDPVVHLVMGLAHMHRSMQRLTAARHFQMLHSLRYLFLYYDIRCKSYTDKEKQEADYNIGRAFHLCGLVSVALKYYNRVLNRYGTGNLKMHAAYNCALIFQESGNAELADDIVRKYLSI